MFRKLISIEEAETTVSTHFKVAPVGKEKVSLSQAFGRILAVDIVSPLNIPPFDRSTVDGYAVMAADTFGADEAHPISLRLCGKVNIGEAPEVAIEKGTAAEIVTGAPLPEGADAAVMVEHAIQEADAVMVHRSISKGENVMKAGSDIPKGSTVLEKGVTLTSREIGVLAAIGTVSVEVFKRPRVAIISTGAEVIEPGEPLSAGKIYDINSETLSNAVRECGGQPIGFGIVEDEPNLLRTTLQAALKTADAVLTSGGVSVGPTDMVPKVLDTLGKPGVIVHGMAVKPGKPTTIAIVDGKPVFALPGHPTSALMIFHLMVRPILTSMTGRTEGAPSTVEAITSERLFPAKGRRTFVTVTLKQNREGRIIASPVPTGLSGAITTLAKADGFIEVHESQQFVDAGKTVKVRLFRSERHYSSTRR